MRRSWSSLLLHQLLVATTTSEATADEEQISLKCAGGTCPNPADRADTPPLMDEPECSFWLGPSPIKEVEAHGFGLGVFTGRPISKGASVEGMDGAELLIPIFDSNLHDEDHWPPLREYVWDGGNMPEIPMESRHGAFLFMPGLAGIAACTSENFNVVLAGPGKVATPRHHVVADSAGVHRANNPTAGSFSYRHNITYTAVRDIVAGEELTVECSDDDFDGGAYYLSRFQSDDNAVACVDNLRGDISTIAGAGRGVFAKRHLSKGSVITSTPLIPIHRKDLDIVDRGDDVNNQGDGARQHTQMLLNYCYGHPRSDLLLLPYGPLANYFNHPPNHKPANAAIRWHPSDYNHDKLPPRQQHHHPELLDLPADTVAEMHGKGLMMDIVALHDIQQDEEIFIDYGPDWTEAWRSHVESWKKQKSEKEDSYKNYISASDYDHANGDENSLIRTVAEQKNDPYPTNLQTVCFYNADEEEWDQDNGERDEEGDKVVYTSWKTREIHGCLRPCIILDHYQENADKDGGGEKGLLYKAKMLPIYSSQIDNECQLDNAHIVMDIPRRAIRIVDRPYTSDMFLENAFRHEIDVPDGFFPETWMQKKVRRRPQQKQQSDHGGDSFRRKQSRNSSVE